MLERSQQEAAKASPFGNGLTQCGFVDQAGEEFLNQVLGVLVGTAASTGMIVNGLPIGLSELVPGSPGDAGDSMPILCRFIAGSPPRNRPH
jgi:hypothetical protein